MKKMLGKLNEAIKALHYQEIVQSQVLQKVLDKDKLMMVTLGVGLPFYIYQKLLKDMGLPLLQNGRLQLE